MSLNDNREWVQLQHVVERMAGKRIPVIGDAMYDHYVFGRVTRICPEAPLPVFVPEREETRPGGAANVAAQLRALGCEPIEIFGANRSTKTRYVVGSQMVGFRIDQDKHSIFSLSDQKFLQDFIQTELPDVVILSDYAKGFVNRLTVECVLPVPWSIVDPKGPNWRKYAGCELLCPNQEELNAAAAQSDDPSDIPDRLVVKRGAKGLRYCLEGNSLDFPATAKHVYDVTGAGDTVVAVLGAALAAECGLPNACRLANLAAGYVVGEVGTTTCSRDTLLKLIEESYRG